MRFRRLTGRWRRLPDFLLIGAMKSGTTALFTQICSHPQVRPPTLKEPHYFTNRPRRSLDWYRSHFPFRGVTGEATSTMLFHRHVPGLVRQRLGRPRLVAMLRDPVDRTISHHRFLALVRDRPPLRDVMEMPRRQHPGDVIEVSRYERQLPRWRQTFAEEDLLMLLYEDYLDAPQATLDRIFAHIGLPPHPVDTAHVENRGIGADADEATRTALAPRFRDTRAYVSDMLGRPVPWRQD